MSVQPSSGEVRLIDAEPVITTNSAEAQVRVLLCDNPAHLTGHTVVGTGRGPAEQVCSRTDEPQGAPLARVGPDDPYLVIEVTPRRAGTVIVEGLRVRYRTDLQRGEQLSGQTVTARSAASQ